MACIHEVTSSKETHGRSLAVVLLCLIAGSSSLASAAQAGESADFDGTARAWVSGDRRSGGAELRANAEAEVHVGDPQSESHPAEESSQQEPTESGLGGDERGHGEDRNGPSRVQPANSDSNVEDGASGTASRLDMSGTATLANRAAQQVDPGATPARAAALVNTTIESGEEFANQLGEQAESAKAEVEGTAASVEVPATEEVLAEAAGSVVTEGDTNPSGDVDAAIASTLKSDISGTVNGSVQDDIRDSIRTDLVTDITRSLPLPGRN